MHYMSLDVNTALCICLNLMILCLYGTLAQRCGVEARGMEPCQRSLHGGNAGQGQGFLSWDDHSDQRADGHDDDCYPWQMSVFF